MKALLTVLGCWAGGPQQGEAASGYLLSVGPTRVLLDCGPGVALALSARGLLDTLDAVVISHRHADHCADLLALAYRRRFPHILPALPLYGPPDLRRVLDGLDALFGIPSLPELARPLGGAFDFRPVEPGDTMHVAGLEAITLAAQHPVPTLSMRWPALGLTYTADSALTPALAAFAVGTPLLLAESTYLSEQGRDLAGHGHMTAAQAATLAREARAGRLLLTHFADAAVAEGCVDAAARVYTGPIERARAGLDVVPVI
ncbi:MAG TPA: MBL fold metallo-hydrolase [Roseiflexaceae bacterium]|nr:MBL fold metallo-hydrolase [Roseiflexaceae bacterium]